MEYACRIACCVGILIILVFPAIAPTAGDKKAADTEAPAVENEKDVQWGEEVEGFRLSIAVDEDEFTPDQPIFLRVTLKNVGSDKIQVEKVGSIRSYKMAVLLPRTEKQAPLTLRGKRLLESPLAKATSFGLAADEEATDTIHLNRVFDMTLSGTYKVTVKRMVPKRDGSDEYTYVTSNAIEITIKERPPREE
jgi:hypothetical protein